MNRKKLAITVAAAAVVISFVVALTLDQPEETVLPDDQPESAVSDIMNAASVSIIGGADGPTSVFVVSNSSGQSAKTLQNDPASKEPVFFRSLRFFENYEGNTFEFYLKGAQEIDKSTVQITCEPSVPFSVKCYYNEIDVCGDFAPNTAYRFRVKSGLKSLSGNTLENDIVAVGRTFDKKPNIRFLSEGSYFPAKGRKLELPFSSVNLLNAKVELFRAYENNLFFDFDAQLYSGNDLSRMEKIGEKLIVFDQPKNTVRNQMLDLEDLFPSGVRKTGCYVVRVTAADPQGDLNISDSYYRVPVVQTFMLSDFAVTAVCDTSNYTGCAVHVRSLEANEPVEDASVTLISTKNQVIASGKTDEDGSVMLKFSSKWKKEDDGVAGIKVVKEKEIGYFPVAEEQKYGVKLDRPRAFVFMERGACRPGESFQVSTFVRQWKNNSFTAMKNAPVTLTVRDPQGMIFAKRTLKTDAYGFVTDEISIPSAGATGMYRCSFGMDKTEWGSESIYVNQYVPDRMKLSLTHADKANGGVFGKKDAVKFTGNADYYFGPAASNLNWQFNISCADAEMPKHWKGWSVGKREEYLESFRESKTIKGDSPMDFSWSGLEAKSWKSSRPVQVSAYLTAGEPGGRSVTTSDRITVFPSDAFIGLKSENTPEGLHLTAGLLAADPDSKKPLAQDLPVQVKVFRTDWEYVLDNSSGTYSRSWKEVRREIKEAAANFTIPADAAPSSWTWNTELKLNNGNYTIVAESGGQYTSEHEVWYYAGEAGTRSRDPKILTFKTDSETYKPGDVATLKFTTAFDGEAFVAGGGLTLSAMKTVQVNSGENEISVDIPENLHTGSFFVQCIAVGKNGEDYQRVQGTAELKIDQKAAHLLNLTIHAQDKAAPGQEITVDIAVANADGKPEGGRLMLFAVDSGVLSLTGFKTPDPYQYFFGRQDNHFELFESYANLFPYLKILPDGTIGGGSAATLAMKRGANEAKQTARLVLPPVVVPKNTGKVNLKVKMPDMTGSMKLMAVMANSSMAGSADTEIKVASPVNMNVTVPRTVAVGDIFAANIRIFNLTGQDASGQLSVACSGMEPQVSNCPVDTLKPNESVDIPVILTATENGSFPVTVTVSLGANSRTEKELITVRPLSAPKTVSELYLIDPGTEKSITIPSGVNPQDASVTVSGLPLNTVSNALNWLNEYPYGCLEQTVSGAFPFLALKALNREGIIDDDLMETNQTRIADAYASILGMRRNDGSFSMWNGGTETWKEGSIYAAHFIFEAAQAKMLTPDPSLLTGMSGWLRRVANDATNQRAVRAYAAYVLAVAGNDGCTVPARNLTADVKDDFAAFLAGAALIRGGYAAEGAKIVQEALKNTFWANADDLPGFSSEASRLGMTLAILHDCGLPDAADGEARLAMRLAKMIRKDEKAWGTTQANAWASYGLAKYAENASLKSFAAEIIAESGSVKTAEMMTWKPSSAAFTVKNTGKSTAYVQVTRPGTPETPEDQTVFAPAQSISLKREYLDANGNLIEQVLPGSLVFVRLTVNIAENSIKNLVIADLLPGGLEIEDAALSTRYSGVLPPAVRPRKESMSGVRLEKRDDRLIVTAADCWKGTHEIVYQLRAVSSGIFHVPEAHAEAMYNPEISALLPADGAFTIE